MFPLAWSRCSIGCVRSLDTLLPGCSWSMPSAGTLVGWSQTNWTLWKSSNNTFTLGIHQTSNQFQRRYLCEMCTLYMQCKLLQTYVLYHRQCHWKGVVLFCPLQLHSIVNPDCSKLGLIKTSLMTKETSWHGWAHNSSVTLCIYRCNPTVPYHSTLLPLYPMQRESLSLVPNWELCCPGNSASLSQRCCTLQPCQFCSHCCPCQLWW